MMTDRERALYRAFYTMLGRGQESRRRLDFKRATSQALTALRLQGMLINEIRTPKTTK